MTYFIFIVEVICSFSFSSILLYYYGNVLKQNPFVTLSCLFVWFFSLIVIFLLPLDISSAFFDACNSSNDTNVSCHMPYSYISKSPIRILWYILYWSLQLLSWVILPIFQSYVSIHYFSMWKRVAWSLIQNGLIFLSLALISLVIMLFLIIKEGWDFNNIIAMAVTASNVWVLFFLILLLGYGLVEVPRYFLKRARYSYYLKYLYFQTAKTYFEKLEFEIEMKDVINELISIIRTFNPQDARMKYVRIIIKKLPMHAQEQFKEKVNTFNDLSLKSESITLHLLEKLHKKTIITTRQLLQTTAHFSQLVSKTVSMENVIDNMGNNKWIFKNLNSSPPRNPYFLFIARIKWLCIIYLLRIFYYFLFVCSIIFSSLIIFSEITIFLNQFTRITLLSYVINFGYLTKNYFTSEFFCIIILGYIALCAYYSVFQIRIFNKYRLAPRHHSNEFSLIFSAILLSRLITSMCLNFLYLVDLARLPNNSLRTIYIIKPTFFDIWGSTIPEIAVLFFIYFPLVIIFIVVSTIFQLDKRILSFFGFQQFIGDANLTSELVLEGKEYIEMERKVLGRKCNLQEPPEFNLNSKSRVNNMRLSTDQEDIYSQKESSFSRDIIKDLFSYFPKRKIRTSPLIKYRALGTEIELSENNDDFIVETYPNTSTIQEICLNTDTSERKHTPLNANRQMPDKKIFGDI